MPVPTLSKNHSKAILIIAICAITFLGFKTYKWLNTESTDNAFLEAHISYISPEISGVVQEIFATEYQTVTAGQALAIIDQENYQNKLQIAQLQEKGSIEEKHIAELALKISQKELEKANEAIQLAQVTLKLNQAEYNRAKKLDAQSFNSQQTLEKLEQLVAKSKYELSAAQLALDIAKKNITLKQSTYQAKKYAADAASHSLKLAQTAFNNTMIRSPIDGIIGNTQLRIGSFARTGMPLLAITPLSGQYVTANFKETQIRHLTIGQEVTVVLDTIKSHPLKGTVRVIAPATGAKFSLIPTDNATGNFTKVIQRVPVIIDIEIPEELRAHTPIGTSATVYIPF